MGLLRLGCLVGVFEFGGFGCSCWLELGDGTYLHMQLHTNTHTHAHAYAYIHIRSWRMTCQATQSFSEDPEKGVGSLFKSGSYIAIMGVSKIQGHLI